MKLKALFVLALALCLSIVAHAAPRPSASFELAASAQSGSICGTGVSHCIVLSWTASTSAAGCTSPCSFGYNVYVGSTAGGENLQTPVNASLIVSNSYIVPVTLTANPQSFYIVVEAVETSGGVTAFSVPSSEISSTFPGTPAPPTNVTSTGKQ